MGCVIELRFQVVEIIFEDVQDAARQVGRGAAIVFQLEVSGLAFAIAFLLGLIALSFLERLLDFWVWTELLGALPFFNGAVHFVRAVIRPAHQLGHIRRIRRGAARAFERVERLGELAFAKIEDGEIQQQADIVRSVRKSLAIVVNRGVGIALAEEELRVGVLCRR